jgi:diadenosine tetraphosphatase ApaH/serine/threonine PP2A family protein phosphatase
MRYAIFTDIHANLEALETVLAKVDELAQKEPIDQLWFLGDLVGYGPNPNECIVKLRERTDVIIAGNHDWAAVGKIDLEDFSEAARISAEWTAQQLTEEHREFLTNLPERLEIDDCTLVHGSPYGPLWEYLTSEVLAERSFQYFATRFCFVGHTHVPIIFQQPDTIATASTHPLANEQDDVSLPTFDEKSEETHEAINDDDDTTELAAVRPQQQTTRAATDNASVAADLLQNSIADATDEVTKLHQQLADDAPDSIAEEIAENATTTEVSASEETIENDAESDEELEDTDNASVNADAITPKTDITAEETILSAEDRLNEEIEELLALLGLSQSMVNVTNEMIIPPEGSWQAPDDYRAIVNPGGVGQPRDGDPRASFMIYDTEHGITFYRIPYPFEKTQQKIIKVGLPRYLATRLAYGR